MPTATEVAELDTEELERQLTETRRELFNLRFQLATGQLDNPARIGQVKKDIARFLTELRSREIAESEGLALEQMPGHLAAARRRNEEEALGRDRSSAAERRAARAAAAAEAEAEAVAGDHDEDEDERQLERAEDDGMGEAIGDRSGDGADEDEDEDEDEDGSE